MALFLSCRYMPDYVTDDMRVLVIGSGGREHALYWKLKQSPLLDSIAVFPGNGGIPEEERITNLDWRDFSALRKFIKKEGFGLVVVGPEDPLVAGIADALSEVCPVFGPSQKAARLEGSKDYSKAFMQKYAIPTASYKSFTDFAAARAYLETLTPPFVIKTDGLAAGKGVAIAEDLVSAEAALRERMLEGKFGEAGKKVVIEEFLEGEEASVFAVCDGKRALSFLASQDHKRAFDGDRGPNTGGMGAYLPVPFMTAAVMEQVQTEILDRVLAGMEKEGHPFRGLLYAGLMVHKGKARVVEFNIRFGDPETQALLPLVKSDLLPLFLQAAQGELASDARIEHKAGASIVVVLAAEGYPQSYKKNILLKNVDAIQGDIIPFHAGTRRTADALVSSGGRVLGLVLTGQDLADVRSRLYADIERYTADGLFYRKDIGAKGV